MRTVGTVAGVGIGGGVSSMAAAPFVPIRLGERGRERPDVKKKHPVWHGKKIHAQNTTLKKTPPPEAIGFRRQLCQEKYLASASQLNLRVGLFLKNECNIFICTLVFMFFGYAKVT